MKKVKMDLAGLDGNAFSLMGQFQRRAREQGCSQTDISAVLTECRSGDYDHLLCTLMANIDDDDYDADGEEDDEEDDEDEYDEDDEDGEDPYDSGELFTP